MLEFGIRIRVSEHKDREGAQRANMFSAFSLRAAP